MVSNSPVIVIGPTGPERHLLVELGSGPGRGERPLARRVLAEVVRPGGSAHFATTALAKLQMPHQVVTSSGHAYLSIWTPDGAKELFVSAADDPTVADIQAALGGKRSKVVALSLHDVTTYRDVAEICRKAKHRLFAAPNQTLLEDPDALRNLLQTTVVCFMNTAELAAAASVTSNSKIGRWYASMRPRGILVVTDSGRELTRFDVDGTCAVIQLPVVDTPAFALGGGDMFTAIAAAEWNDGTPVQLAAAATRASKFLQLTNPFPNFEVASMY